MATEFKLSYTGSEVNAKLGKIDSLVDAEERLTDEIAVERARINTFTALATAPTSFTNPTLSFANPLFTLNTTVSL